MLAAIMTGAGKVKEALVLASYAVRIFILELSQAAGAGEVFAVITTAIKGMGAALMSVTGLAIGLVAAIGTLIVLHNKWQGQGKESGNALSKSILDNVTGKDGTKDGLHTYDEYIEATRKLGAAEKALADERHKSGGLWNWDKRTQLREGEKVQAAERKRINAVIATVKAGAKEAKTTTSEAFRILDNLKLDPATMDKNQVATTVAQELDRIKTAADATGLSMEKAGALGSEALDAWAKKAQAAQQATAGVLAQFGDILGVDLTAVSADTVSSAQKNVADAQKALNELRAGGSSSLAEASQRAREAADAEADAVDNLESARHHLEVARTKDIGEVSWDELVNSEKAVKDGERELAQLRAKHAEERAAENQKAAKASADAADKEREAVDKLAEARKKLKDVEDEANKSPLTKIIDNYVESARKLDDFENLIRGAVERGFDPALIDRIIQAGPEKGIPILTAMVKDATDAQVTIINNYERLMAESRARILRQQGLTGYAVGAQENLGGKEGRQIAADLDIAIRMDQVMGEGGPDSKSVKAMAARLGVTEDVVKRVAKEYETMLGKELFAADEHTRKLMENKTALIRFHYEPYVTFDSGNVERAVSGFMARLSATIAAAAAAANLAAIMANVTNNIAGMLGGSSLIPKIVLGTRLTGSGHAGGALVAQIGRNTRYRWAEPETGGEALIPRFTRNQARSESIAKTVAGWLGGQFVTAKELGKTRFSFADGGIAAAQPGNVWGSLAGTPAPAPTSTMGMGMGDIRIEKLIVTGDRGPKGAIAVLREARKRRWLGASSTMGGSTQW